MSLETVKSGAYTLWSYVHVLVGPAASSNAATIASTLVTQIKAKDTAYLNNLNYGTLALSDITNNVSRAANIDGGTVGKVWTNNTPIKSLFAY